MPDNEIIVMAESHSTARGNNWCPMLEFLLQRIWIGDSLTCWLLYAGQWARMRAWNRSRKDCTKSGPELETKNYEITKSCSLGFSSTKS